ncbi:MAG: hypothetical protein HYX68_17660 [Planctomycetes bacterium]|jgi:hypothetical protein|nr:hypothetical protein [Planctomycetota bacterium]
MIHVKAFAVVATVLGCFVLTGCGGVPKSVVTGRITNKGEPIPVKPMVGKLKVWFILQDVPPPVDPKYANVKDDGSFDVTDSGNGIVAGKYKICIQWYDNFPQGPDKLKERFSEKNSKIFRKIPDDGVLNIDVSRPEG